MRWVRRVLVGLVVFAVVIAVLGFFVSSGATSAPGLPAEMFGDNQVETDMFLRSIDFTRLAEQVPETTR